MIGSTASASSIQSSLPLAVGFGQKAKLLRPRFVSKLDTGLYLTQGVAPAWVSIS